MASETSSAEMPSIQVLEKEHYFSQAIVPIPSTGPPLPLAAPSSVRLRTKVLALTANNFTYAKLGFLFHWWDIHPLPAAIPPPYADDTKYGRLSAWGWAEVLESTHASVPTGSLLWGYQPIGTLTQDLAVRDCDVAGHVVVTSEHRQKAMPIYNRYFTATGAAADALRREIEDRADGPAYDAVVRIMFETAYLLNRYCLGSPGTPPSAAPGSAPWTPEQASIRGATVIVLAPGSKVGLCFARELRHMRKEGERPTRIIGAASGRSTSFVEATGLYDAVVSATGSPVEILAGLGVAKEEKIVLVDFGGRADAGPRWALALQPMYDKFLMLGVGVEVSEVSQADLLAGLQAGVTPQQTFVNANDVRDQAMKLQGADKYFEELQRAWDLLRKEGLKGLELRWGTGMQDVRRGWDELATGKLKPEEGLAFVI
ncbi:hypothetical protein CDD83_10178 [Cordyceps sp. RAO-2017]|nr:hypothetical protein CDD83_10178 [Cordyceps sp. RAO-2017]